MKSGKTPRKPNCPCPSSLQPRFYFVFGFLCSLILMMLFLRTVITTGKNHSPRGVPFWRPVPFLVCVLFFGFLCFLQFGPKANPKENNHFLRGPAHSFDTQCVSLMGGSWGMTRSSGDMCLNVCVLSGIRVAGRRRNQFWTDLPFDRVMFAREEQVILGSARECRDGWFRTSFLESTGSVCPTMPVGFLRVLMVNTALCTPLPFATLH